VLSHSGKKHELANGIPLVEFNKYIKKHTQKSCIPSIKITKCSCCLLYKSLLNHLSDATSSHRSAHHVLSRNLSHMPPPDSCPSRSQIRSSGELRNFRGFYGRCFDGKIIQLNGGPMPLPPNELLCGKAYTINHPEVRFIRLLPWKVTLIGSAAKPF